MWLTNARFDPKEDFSAGSGICSVYATCLFLTMSSLRCGKSSIATTQRHWRTTTPSVKPIPLNTSPSGLPVLAQWLVDYGEYMSDGDCHYRHLPSDARVSRCVVYVLCLLRRCNLESVAELSQGFGNASSLEVSLDEV